MAGGRPRKEPPNRSDGRYEVKVVVGTTFDGKKERKSFYSTISKEDARRQAEEHLRNLALSEITGVNLVQNRTKFSEIAEDVMLIRKEKIRYNTFVTNWEIPLRKHLIPVYGNWQIQNINKSDIEKYFIRNKDKSLSWLRKQLTCLKSVFQYAVDNKIVFSNPIQNFKVEVGVKQKTEKHVYDENQIQLVLDYCKDHVEEGGLDVDLLLRTGLRKSELMGLQYGDIDFKKKTAKIQRSIAVSHDKKVARYYVQEPKNEKSKRTVLLSEKSIELMQNRNTVYVIAYNATEAYDPDVWNKKYNKFMRAMRKYYRRKGIDIPILTPHELRHTACTTWVHRNVNITAVCEQMGWTSPKMILKVYGHVDISQFDSQFEF